MVFDEYDDIVAGACLRDGEFDAVPLAAVESATQNSLQNSHHTRRNALLSLSCLYGS
jgi:hypothetical protein